MCVVLVAFASKDQPNSIVLWVLLPHSYSFSQYGQQANLGSGLNSTKLEIIVIDDGSQPPLEPGFEQVHLPSSQWFGQGSMGCLVCRFGSVQSLQPIDLLGTEQGKNIDNGVTASKCIIQSYCTIAILVCTNISSCFIMPIQSEPPSNASTFCFSMIHPCPSFLFRPFNPAVAGDQVNSGAHSMAVVFLLMF